MAQTPDPRKTKIRFLAHQKFPRQVDLPGAPSGRRRSSQLVSLEEIEAERYVSALGKLSDTELDNRYEKAVEELLTEADRREAAQPFNQPYARADVSRWAKMAYWAPDEAVALSLGRDPRFANWEKLQQLVQSSRFAYSYAAQREIVMRARDMGQLWGKTPPALFLAWTERRQFSMPDDLSEAVKAIGTPAVDWKTLFDQSQLQVEALSKRIEELEREKSRAETERLGTRERESLLKLIIGMARGGYGYDPSAGRSSTAKEIASDLASVGLSLDEDTVRKYLAAGKELLPRDETE
jgi:hypothetical protein